jgi:spore maturation protein SpmB
MTQFLLPSGQFCANLPFLKTMRMDAHIGVLTTIITRVRVDPCTAIIDLSTWMYGTDTQLYMFQEAIRE